MTFILIFQFLFLLLLLAFSAFFSGSETALMRLSKIKIKHWIYLHPAQSEAWASWLSKPQELITTILVGNTLANIFFSSMMATFSVTIFRGHNSESVQAFSGIVAFFLVLVFGEIVPKIYAMQNSDKISSITLGHLFNLSKFLGTPLKGFLDLLGKTFPVFKLPPPGRISTLTLDEMRSILLHPSSLKGLEKDSYEMMKRVLESHQTTVSQIMTPWEKVDFLVIEEALAGGTKMERFIDHWVESGHSRLPVLKGSTPRLFGYLYVNDLLSCIAHEKKIDPSLCQKWVREMPAIDPDQKIGSVLNLFRFGAPIASVQDRFGALLGIVTMEDILEEFVGEILDEYDLEQKESGQQ